MANEADKKTKKEKRPTAQKRDIQNSKRRLRNRTFRSKVKTTIKHFEEILKAGTVDAVKAKLSEVYSIMDKGVKHGVFKKNKANRTKARLAAHATPKA